MDVDPDVLENPLLDEAYVLTDAQIPLGDASVDMLVADYVFEHLPNPSETADAMTRVLKPGGWLCARTPNRWGYIALGSQLLPHMLHSFVLRRVQPARSEADVFRTYYRLNTMKVLVDYFPAARFDDFTYPYDPDPAYFGASAVANTIVHRSATLLPERFSAILMVFMRKR